MYSFVTLFFTFLALTFADLSSEFKRCDRKAADFKQCLNLAVEDAIKQLKEPVAGLPGLEPVEIESMQIKSEREDANFTGIFSKYELHGLATSDFMSYASIDFAANTFVLDLIYPQLEDNSDCEFVGSLKGQSITGKGSVACVGKVEKIAVTFQLEEYTKDGKSYYRISETKFLVSGESESCNFDKFDGEISAENLTKLVNDNIKLFVAEVTDEFETSLGALFQSYFEIVLDNASIDELFGEA